MAAISTLVSANPVWIAIRNLAIVFGVILFASLFGIFTRPVGLLAAVWPANAILLGMMVRNPHLATRVGWLAAFAGFITADLATGGELSITLWLTITNMAGAYLGYRLFMQLEPEDRRLSRPSSIVSLFGISVLAAGTAATVGAGAAQVVFGRDLLTGFVFWFTTELVNMIVILPAILACPSPDNLRLLLRRKVDISRLMPGLALTISLVVSPIVGGPGAIAYPVPALIWCALSYNLFTTTLLSLCFSLGQLMNAASGATGGGSGVDDLMASVSIRLAIVLIALGPLAVASVNVAREELLDRLHHTANHDYLTGALSRGAFMERSQHCLNGATIRPSLAILMLDLDHFKTINDLHGHPTGDRVLAEVVRQVKGSLRSNDLIGRLGGEEFALLLTSVTKREALSTAERIRSMISSTFVVDDTGTPLRVTASIGLVYGDARSQASLSELLSRADRALYEAKLAGRNRVVMAGAISEAGSERPAA